METTSHSTKGGLQTYTAAVSIIKDAILRSQYRAASLANNEQLSLYYGIGRYISQNSRKGFWGKGAIEAISRQLQKELPGLRGFSSANIKFMRQFYEAWCNDLKSLTAVSETDIQALIPHETFEKEEFDPSSFFGRDFAFVGNQYKLEVHGVEHFPDLIFFNRELNALVVIELKKGAFKSSYLGQLSTYLRLVDDQIRKPHENPSIGLVLCKSADKKYVEYVIQDYDKPLGVAIYKTSGDMPEKLKRALPDVEDLRKLL